MRDESQFFEKMVGVGGEELGAGVAGGEDEGLAARRGAGVPDADGGSVGGGG